LAGQPPGSGIGSGGGYSGGLFGSAGIPGMAPSSFAVTYGQTDTNVTRVYALGGLASSIKFDDLERALREVLDEFGANEKDSKLAFHDKLNVLIVRGEPAAHEAVAQVISALTSNASDQQRLAQGNLNQKLEILQAKIEKLEHENSMLQDRLQAHSGKPPAPEPEPKR
jgi:hypothetical protein